MKAKLVFLLAVLNYSIASAQDIEVKKFEPLQKDQTAVTSPRKDINGNSCGLVKVLLKEPGAEFEGSVMGNVQFTGNEYLVYLPNGTKRLGIKHPDYLPTTIVFANYGTKSIVSGTTYQLIVKANKEKPKKESSKRGTVVFQLTPSSATLIVDNTPVSQVDGGLYSMELPYGTHYYTVQYRDFSISNQAVKVDKEPKTVNLDLTDFFANISITCEERDAAIYINDEMSGVGSLDEMVTPGVYVIQAKKDGFYPQSQTVTLEDNEDFKLNFGKMKAMTGIVKIDYEPIGSDIYLDGQKMGVTPMEIKNVTIGKHILEVKNANATPLKSNIVVSDEKVLSVKGSLPMTRLGVLLNEAAKGDGCAMVKLGLPENRDSYEGGYTLGWDVECESCGERYTKMCSILGDGTITKEEGIRWLERALQAPRCHIDEYTIMNCIAQCYMELDQYDKSFSWAERCYNSYNGESAMPAIRLAWYYYYGVGVSKDIQKARKVLEKAINKVMYISDPSTFEKITIRSIDQPLDEYIRSYSSYSIENGVKKNHISNRSLDEIPLIVNISYE